MNIALQSACVILFVGIFLTFAQGESLTDEPRIKQGQLAKPGQFPFVVFIRMALKFKKPSKKIGTDKHYCSGFLITPRSVVTASHCVPAVLLYILFDNRLKFSIVRLKFTVEAGILRANVKGDLGLKRSVDNKQIRTVAYPDEVDVFIYNNDSMPVRHIKHPFDGYTIESKSFYYDMAVLQLKQNPFALTDAVGTVPFMDPLRNGYLGAPGENRWLPFDCYVVGFGKQDEFPMKWDGYMYYLKLQVGGFEACQFLRMKYFFQKMCGRGEIPPSSVCRGDSGGPMVCLTKRNEYVALGLASISVGLPSACKDRHWQDAPVRTSYEILSELFINAIEPDAVNVSSSYMYQKREENVTARVTAVSVGAATDAGGTLTGAYGTVAPRTDAPRTVAPRTDAPSTGTTGAKSNASCPPSSHGVLVICILCCFFKY